MIPEKISSLVLLRKNGSILLGLKKRGFGCGKWNGFGGKIENGETLIDCAKRELTEECGITAKSLEKVGYLKFEFVEEPLFLHVHVFTTSEFSGKPFETEEMCPRWFPETELPLQDMWADDKYWFPYFLKGVKFSGYFKFLDMERILEYQLKESSNLLEEHF